MFRAEFEREKLLLYMCAVVYQKHMRVSFSFLAQSGLKY